MQQRIVCGTGSSLLFYLRLMRKIYGACKWTEVIVRNCYSAETLFASAFVTRNTCCLQSGIHKWKLCVGKPNPWLPKHQVFLGSSITYCGYWCHEMLVQTMSFLRWQAYSLDGSYHLWARQVMFLIGWLMLHWRRHLSVMMRLKHRSLWSKM